MMNPRNVRKAACVASVYALLLSGCSGSNNLLLGEVATTLGKHSVLVTDCYRLSVPQPEEAKNTTGSIVEYHWTPCRDAVIVIRAEALSVNGAPYGILKTSDRLTVDHGKVLINDQAAVATAK